MGVAEDRKRTYDEELREAYKKIQDEKHWREEERKREIAENERKAKEKEEEAEYLAIPEVQHWGWDCWWECGGGGPCQQGRGKTNWCGRKGMCCRQHYYDDYCGSHSGCHMKHCCIQNVNDFGGWGRSVEGSESDAAMPPKDDATMPPVGEVIATMPPKDDVTMPPVGEVLDGSRMNKNEERLIQKVATKARMGTSVRVLLGVAGLLFAGAGLLCLKGKHVESEVEIPLL